MEQERGPTAPFKFCCHPSFLCEHNRFIKLQFESQICLNKETMLLHTAWVITLVTTQKEKEVPLTVYPPSQEAAITSKTTLK